jgi:hypothetical protein
LNAVKRRLELLKLEGEGLSQAEIVKELKTRTGCSARTVYNDFETRAVWQPTLQSLTKPDDLLLKILNRYEHAYRLACELFKSSSHPLVKLGCLNTMLKANSSIREVTNVHNTLFLTSARLIESKPLELDEKLSAATKFEDDPKLRKALLQSIAEQKSEKEQRHAPKTPASIVC